MATIRRSERRERIERDDGDPDATVYVARGGTNASGLGYHEDPDCVQLARATDTAAMDRETAQAASRYPCSVCILEDAGDPGGKRGTYLAQALRRDDIQTIADAKAYVDERGDA